MLAPHQNLSGVVGNRIMERQVFGAGIASLGYFQAKINQKTADSYSLEAEPGLSM